MMLRYRPYSDILLVYTRMMVDGEESGEGEMGEKEDEVGDVEIIDEYTEANVSTVCIY